MNKYEQIKGMANPNRGSVGVQEARPPQRTEPLIGCVNHDCDKCKERKPLTDEEIWNAIRPLTKSDQVCKALVDVSMDEYRAIEAAHDIKENT